MRNDPTGTILTFDGMDDGHILRIAGSFEPAMFHDGQFVSRKDSSAADVSERLIEKIEICCESPLS